MPEHNEHVAWRMRVAERAAAAYTRSPKLAALTVAPDQLTGRLDQLVSSPLADAFGAAEQLLTDITQLAGTRTGAELTGFRAELSKVRCRWTPGISR